MGSDSQYFFGQGSALPPDVRRWLCPAVDVASNYGLCPWCGLWPNETEKGHSPGFIQGGLTAGQSLRRESQLRRQSRTEHHA